MWPNLSPQAAGHVFTTCFILFSPYLFILLLQINKPASIWITMTIAIPNSVKSTMPLLSERHCVVIAIVFKHYLELKFHSITLLCVLLILTMKYPELVDKWIEANRCYSNVCNESHHCQGPHCFCGRSLTPARGYIVSPSLDFSSLQAFCSEPTTPKLPWKQP